MLYGHKDKIKAFKSLAKNDNLGQAYLFFGEPQIGKFLFVKHLAYFLEHGQFEVLKKPLVDSIIVSSDEDNIKLDDLSEFRNFIAQKPLKSSKRLIIIDECQKLTPHAQSSLLKYVEEASDHTSFVFIGTDPQVLLPPLSSRLMKVHFSKLSDKEIEKILIDDKDVSEKKAKKITKEAFGRIGLALNMVDGKQKDKEDEEIIDYLDRKIKELYLEDKNKNSKALSRLLKREEEIHRYNINPRVQKKAIKFELK